MIQRTTQCTPAGGRGAVQSRATPTQRYIAQRLPPPAARSGEAASTVSGGGRRRAAREASEHRRVPPALSDSERGGSCGERGIRTLGRLLTYVRLASGRGCPHRPVLAAEAAAARFLPPPNAVLAAEAAAARGVEGGRRGAHGIGATQLSRVMRSTLASTSGSAPDSARGARCAPRQSLHAQHSGGAARSLRQGGCVRRAAGDGGSMSAQQSPNRKSLARLELFARQHRSSLTESEAALWSALNARQLGVSFRRQVPVAGRFIADFCALSIQLIVEVDGPIHARKPGSDARRDRKLQRAGFRVVRVSAQLVLTDLAAAVALVRDAL